MFKVPIIPPDLRHEETIIQAAYALDCLQNTIGIIFERIDNRIEKNNVKVRELQERIKKSQDKIISLQGTRKAIRIYAPARFPSSFVFKDLPVTFIKRDEVGLKSISKYQVTNKLGTNLPSLNEKLTFFHVRNQESVKLTSENSLAKERCSIKQNQDLGIMPLDLRSTPSVLLFNTEYSVYNFDECNKEGSGHLDSWKRAKILKNKRQQLGNIQQAKQLLEPAPSSLVNRRSEKLTPSGGLKYTPKLSEAPELDLPLDLPDLPGIADDLRYESADAKQKIAPSLALAVENLPELKDLMKDNCENEVHNNSNLRSPPPRPPPPPVIKSVVPPPPPPPPVLDQHLTQAKILPPTNTDIHSELMAAIRNVGGVEKATLRRTAAAPLAANDNDVIDNAAHVNPSVKMKNSLGGDLMADLHNKLLMRRKGISGSKDNKSDISSNRNSNKMTSANTPSGNPVISRLSSLIPPPLASKQISNSAATSEEDDEDESNDTDWAD